MDMFRLKSAAVFRRQNRADPLQHIVLERAASCHDQRGQHLCFKTGKSGVRRTSREDLQRAATSPSSSKAPTTGIACSDRTVRASDHHWQQSTA